MGLLKKYCIIGAIFVSIASLLLVYKYVNRNGLITFELVLITVGQSSIILAGYYISSKFILKKFNVPVLIKDLTECIAPFSLAVLITYEILHIIFFLNQKLYVVFHENLVASILFYLGFIIVVTSLIYLIPFINKSFQKIDNLMRWENTALILLYLLITIPTTTISNWMDWFEDISTLGLPDISLPPISILITVYAITACVLFFFSNNDNSQVINVPNPVPQTLPTNELGTISSPQPIPPPSPDQEQKQPPTPPQHPITSV